MYTCFSFYTKHDILVGPESFLIFSYFQSVMFLKCFLKVHVPQCKLSTGNSLVAICLLFEEIPMQASIFIPRLHCSDFAQKHRSKSPFL